MSLSFQVSFDADDPPALARFCAVALGYESQPPPEGFDGWPAFAESVGLNPDEAENFAALVDPEERRPRLFFRKVPEGKQAKNQIHIDIEASRAPRSGRSAPRAVGGPAMLPTTRHLDVNAGAPDHNWAKVLAHVELLREDGGTVVEERTDEMSRWIVMLDPEGNEFCGQ